MGALQENTVVYVNDSANFELQVIEDVILNGWTIAASETRTKYALLTVITLYSVKQLIVFPHNLDLRISTAVVCTSHEPTAHSQCPKQSSTSISNSYFVLQTWHILETTPS